VSSCNIIVSICCSVLQCIAEKILGGGGDFRWWRRFFAEGVSLSFLGRGGDSRHVF